MYVTRVWGQKENEGKEDRSCRQSNMSGDSSWKSVQDEKCDAVAGDSCHSRSQRKKKHDHFCFLRQIQTKKSLLLHENNLTHHLIHFEHTSQEMLCSLKLTIDHSLPLASSCFVISS